MGIECRSPFKEEKVKIGIRMEEWLHGNEEENNIGSSTISIARNTATISINVNSGEEWKTGILTITRVMECVNEMMLRKDKRVWEVLSSLSLSSIFFNCSTPSIEWMKKGKEVYLCLCSDLDELNQSALRYS